MVEDGALHRCTREAAAYYRAFLFMLTYVLSLITPCIASAFCSLLGRLDAEAHRILVKSSADGGMNTLRVWGGGIFYPTAFYDACDEYGVLVYHDMQYASTGGGAHGPIATATQEAELRHQIRRLSHHPAIVLWDGNNEIPVNAWQPSGVFASFVMTIVAQEDQSRAVWPVHCCFFFLPSFLPLFFLKKKENIHLPASRQCPFLEHVASQPVFCVL